MGKLSVCEKHFALMQAHSAFLHKVLDCAIIFKLSNNDARFCAIKQTWVHTAQTYA